MSETKRKARAYKPHLGPWISKPQALKKARAKRLWSQARLAEEAGVSKPTIERMERAPHGVMFETMQKVCEALGVAPPKIAKQRTDWRG